MEQAVVFFDVDGTLLSDVTGRVPESAKEALRRLIERGHIPVINTGRPYSHVVPQVKALPIRDYVCSCGLYILMDGKVIQDSFPDKSMCRKMRDLIIDCGLDCIFEAKDGVYYIDGHSINFGFRPEQMERLGIKLYNSDDLMSEDFHFDKFGVWYNDSCDYPRFAKEVEKYFTLILRSPTFTELVTKGYSKGLGMKKYLESLPPAKRTVYAFGDSPNDMEMFRASDVRVLMGNGDMALRSEVDYITDSVDDDGVLHALEHFGLI